MQHSCPFPTPTTCIHTRMHARTHARTHTHTHTHAPTHARTHAHTHTTHLEDNVLLLLLCEGGSGGSHTGVGVGCWHQHLRAEGVRRRRKSEGEKVGGGK